MPDSPDTTGLSLLSKLDRYWIKNASRPAIMPNERLVSVTSEHWIKYVFPSFLFLALLAGSFALLSFSYFNITTSQEFSVTLFLLGLLLFLYALHWYFWVLLAESEAKIIITNKRVIHVHDRLFLQEQMLEVSFEKMKTVEAEKSGFLQNVLGYGTLFFEGNKARIELVPHPSSLARDIEQAMGMI